jgi:hypothetical protein
MRKTRLLMLLLVLVLTALTSFTAVPVAQADDYCWQFSDQDCVYYYNSATGCCEGIPNHPGVPVCPDICE